MFSGIQRVKQYLKVNDGRAKLYLFPNCVNLIRELKTYRFGDGDLPKKTDDHALDELRYYLMTKPENLPPFLSLKYLRRYIPSKHLLQ